MTRRTAKRTPRQSNDHAGLIRPAELVAHPGEDIAIDPGPPLTPDKQFRERVAAAWAWVKAVRFREHECERLARVFVEIDTNEVNDEQK